MASLLPTLQKTWEHHENQILVAQVSADLQNRQFCLAFKNQLKALTAFPWTVVGSSSSNVGTFSATDGVDRWTTTTDIAINNWIIVRQTAFGFNFDMLIQRSVSNLTAVYISSGDGFTGGALTTRPTATDEVAIITSGAADLSSLSRHIMTVSQSTDGTSLRMWLFAGSAVKSMLIIDKMKNPISQLTKPWIATWTPTVTHAGLFLETGTWFGYHAGALTFATTSEAVRGSTATQVMLGEFTAGQVANELSGSYFMAPIGALCVTNTKRGRHGELYDLWTGSAILTNGDTYPGAAESPLHQFVQVGVLIFPFPPTVVPLTA